MLKSPLNQITVGLSSVIKGDLLLGAIWKTRKERFLFYDLDYLHIRAFDKHLNCIFHFIRNRALGSKK